MAVPLTFHSRETLRDAALDRAVTQAVVEWDDEARVRELDANVDGGLGVVELLVSSPGEPRSAQRLAEESRERFGGPVDLRLLFQRDEQFVVSAR